MLRHGTAVTCNPVLNRIADPLVDFGLAYSCETAHIIPAHLIANNFIFNSFNLRILQGKKSYSHCLIAFPLRHAIISGLSQHINGVSVSNTTTTNATLTAKARASLQGQWGIAIAALVVSGILAISISCIPFIGSIAWLLIAGPLAIGYARFNLALLRRDSARIEILFSGFRQFDTGVIAYLLIAVFIFLWTLLLIIPGIIAAYAYSMAYFIIAEDDGISAMNAIRKSKEMMYGHKWRYFCLCMRLTGWLLLGCIPFGIGLLWAIPYMMTSQTHFYEDLKNRNADMVVESSSLPVL